MVLLDNAANTDECLLLCAASTEVENVVLKKLKRQQIWFKREYFFIRKSLSQVFDNQITGYIDTSIFLLPNIGISSKKPVEP